LHSHITQAKACGYQTQNDK